MTTLTRPAPLDLNVAEPAQPAAQRIALTGFMGAGKSTVGRLLASTLGWEFVDLDAEVERQAERTIAALFEQEGEETFRRLESAALARALGRTRVVIALGGGAPERLTNRLLLEQTPETAVVFLDAPFPVLFDRCVLQEGAAVRPVLLDADAAAERFRMRAPFYRRCAQHHLQTERQAPEETAEAIRRVLTR